MKFDKGVFFQFVLFSVLTIVANLLIQSIFQLEIEFEKTTYSLANMLLFFISTSFILLLVHNYIHNKKKDLLGYVFMVSLTIKIFACYIFIAPVLNNKPLNHFEKTYKIEVSMITYGSATLFTSFDKNCKVRLAFE